MQQVSFRNWQMEFSAPVYFALFIICKVSSYDLEIIYMSKILEYLCMYLSKHEEPPRRTRGAVEIVNMPRYSGSFHII